MLKGNQAILNKMEETGIITPKNGMQPFLQLADLQWMYYWQKAVVC